jgi:cobalamin biosynthesis protein CobT
MPTTTNWKLESSLLGRELVERGNNFKLTFTSGQEGITWSKNSVTLPDVKEGVPLTEREITLLRGAVDEACSRARYSEKIDYKKEFGDREKQASVIHDMLEATRTETRYCNKYHGASRNLKEMIRGSEKPEHPVMKELYNKVRLAQYGLRETQEGEELIPNELIRECERIFHSETTGSQDLINSTKEILKLIDPEDDVGDPPQEEQQEGEGEGEGDNKGEGNPKDGKSQDRQNTGKAEAKELLSKLVNETAKGFSDTDQTIEYDDTGEALPYKVPWDLVRDKIWHDPKWRPWGGERNSPASAEGFVEIYDRVKIDIASSIAVAKNKLRIALLSKENRSWERALPEGNLDPKRFAHAIAGQDEYRMKRRETEDINTAVLVLVDLSGSMGGEKILQATQMAVVLNECLMGTGVKYKIAGHYATSGYNGEPSIPYQDCPSDMARLDSVFMPCFKDWDETYTQSKNNIGCMLHGAGSCNADACAIQYAYSDLEKRREKKRLLIYISDGQPACSHTLSNYTFLATYRQHIRYMESNYRKQGIETIGLGLGPGTKHIKTFHKYAHKVDNISEFTGKILGVVAKEIIDGDRQR